MNNHNTEFGTQIKKRPVIVTIVAILMFALCYFTVETFLFHLRYGFFLITIIFFIITVFFVIIGVGLLRSNKKAYTCSLVVLALYFLVPLSLFIYYIVTGPISSAFPLMLLVLISGLLLFKLTRQNVRDYFSKGL